MGETVRTLRTNEQPEPTEQHNENPDRIYNCRSALSRLEKNKETLLPNPQILVTRRRQAGECADPAPGDSFQPNTPLRCVCKVHDVKAAPVQFAMVFHLSASSKADSKTS